MQKFFVLSLFISSFATMAASTTVYQCNKDGVVQFSQFPCGDDAKQIQIHTSRSTIKSDKPADGLESVDSFLEMQEIDREISQHQSRINTYTRQMEDEISLLQNQSNAQVNNLAGSNKQNAIAQEMEAVTKRYQALISREQMHIDRLQARKQNLASQKPSSGQNTSVDSYIKTQQVDREMQKTLDKIDAYHAQMDKELAQLRQEAAQTPENLADTSYNNALSQRMTAVTAKYTTLIDVEQKKAARLTQERAEIQND